MTAREIAITELGIDSMTTYRRGRADGTIPADRYPTDIFLVIDGWSTFKQEFEPQEQTITNIANSGLGFGIHVMISAAKWSEMRSNLRDAIQSRVELKLGDAFESEINRKAQGLVPAGRPGRGVTAEVRVREQARRARDVGEADAREATRERRPAGAAGPT